MSKHGYSNVYLDRSSGKRYMGRVWTDRISAENQIGRQIDAPVNAFVSASHLQYEGTAYVNWEVEKAVSAVQPPYGYAEKGDGI